MNLSFLSKTMLNWAPPIDPGATLSTLVYDTLRSGLASNFQGVADCIESNDGSNTSATDLGTPSAGQVFFYLTRAENSCGLGTGSLGTNSQGVERAGRSCP